MKTLCTEILIAAALISALAAAALAADPHKASTDTTAGSTTTEQGHFSPKGKMPSKVRNRGARAATKDPATC